MTRSVARSIAIVAIAWVPALIVTGCSPLCGEDVVADKASPDGKFVAVTFARNCGATTPFVTHVNLRAANERFNAGWDGTIRKSEILSVRNLEPVEIVWVAGGVRLHVRTSAIITCSDTVAGLKVSCAAPNASRKVSSARKRISAARPPERCTSSCFGPPRSLPRR
jgi:hypothetical protein